MFLGRTDFNGDGRAEIPISSPWGIGILELAGSSLSSPVMAANGTRFGGWLLNTADNLFEATADFDGDGHDEIFIASPWGIGVLKRRGSALDALMLAPNGTRFGGWLLSTADNRFGPVGDFDGDGQVEILVTSPWGIGVFKLSGATFTVPMMAPNGTRFGGWLLNTADNRFGPVGDIDADRRDEILVTSPWGIGLLKLQAASLNPVLMAPNGTRFGGWLLNTEDNHFGAISDYDGDGAAELFVSSPWGIGVLEPTGSSLTSLVMEPNGTRIGGWLLNSLDNRILPVGDYDGDGRDELLLVSPWGIGILEIEDRAFAVHFMAPNGTRFGGWLLNTADNRFDAIGDYDGDGRSELVVTSPWGLGILDFNGSSATAAMLAPNGTRFGGWLLNTADNHVGFGPELIRVHVKVLTNPTVSIDQMFVAMDQVYEAVGIRVQRASTEILNLPTLNDVDVGSCSGTSVTAEQTQLFGNRNSASPLDVVVYFVRSTNPPLNGCATHPTNQPGAVVTQIASRWTMAHEIGHVLGLAHVNDNNRLMTGNGTSNITNPPPDLIAPEVITMKGSPITHGAER